jgi:hypothetical protein
VIIHNLSERFGIAIVFASVKCFLAVLKLDSIVDDHTNFSAEALPAMSSSKGERIVEHLGSTLERNL